MTLHATKEKKDTIQVVVHPVQLGGHYAGEKTLWQVNGGLFVHMASIGVVRGWLVVCLFVSPFDQDKGVGGWREKS